MAVMEGDVQLSWPAFFECSFNDYSEDFLIIGEIKHRMSISIHGSGTIGGFLGEELVLFVEDSSRVRVCSVLARHFVSMCRPYVYLLMFRTLKSKKHR